MSSISLYGVESFRFRVKVLSEIIVIVARQIYVPLVKGNVNSVIF